LKAVALLAFHFPIFQGALPPVKILMKPEIWVRRLSCYIYRE
jgi:hypothetical protein